MKHKTGRRSRPKTLWRNISKQRKRATMPAAIACAISLAGAQAQAEEIDWIGGNGAWEDAANWPGGIFPTDEDFIRLPTGVTVTSSGNTNIAEELLSRAELNILDGLFSVVGTIDSLDDFILFPNSSVNAGRIFIQAGALFDVAADTNVSVVEGVFSSGMVDIHDRGTVNAESFDNFNQWDIRDEGAAIANSIINHQNAVLEVFEAGSLFDINGNLTNDGSVIARNTGSAEIDSIDNEGILDIKSGAELSGNSIDNYNSVIVRDNGTEWTAAIVTNYSGEIELNNEANGTVGNLDNRASLKVDNSSLMLTDGINANGGSINISNDGLLTVVNVLTNASDVTIDSSSHLASATFQQIAGATRLDGGEIGAAMASLTAITAGSLNGYGNIRGDLEITDSGVLAPDNGPLDPSGTLTISDGLSLAGVFNVDLGATDITDFDRLVVGASATLAGTLNVSLVSGFTPLVGDFFDIILATSVTGDFDQIFLPMLGNGLALEASNEGTFYRLQVTAVPVPPALPVFLMCLLYLKRRVQKDC